MFNKNNKENKEVKEFIKNNLGGFLHSIKYMNLICVNTHSPETNRTKIQTEIKDILNKENKEGKLNIDNIKNRLYELIGEKLEIDNVIKFEDFESDDELKKAADKRNKELKEMKKQEKQRKKEEEKLLTKEEKKIRKLEEKYNVDLTNKTWFECTLEEIRHGTISNNPQRDVVHAYIIVNENNLEILKESLFIKSNMGNRKIYFNNIASIDLDTRGKFNLSCQSTIHTKSSEHITVKNIDEDSYNEMVNAYNSYLENKDKLQNNSSVSTADELLKYAELYEKGLLTEEEFNMKKEELLKKY